MDLKRTVGALVVGLAVAAGGVVATSAPAQAAQVNNMYLCEPDTGWCFQTNPPYNPNFPRACRWDYKLHNLTSGMWYTGCTPGYWGPEIH